jgi:archaetidylinositol phosphate synthase
LLFLGGFVLSGIRKSLKPFVEFVASPFAKLGIDPNILSFVAVPLAFISGYFIASGVFFLAFIFAVLSVSIDLFDGAVARLQNRQSLFGNYIETIIDKVVEIVLFISCSFVHPFAAASALGFSMLVSYAKPRVALVIITDNRDWPGVGEHSERMILLVSGLLLSSFGINFSGVSALELFLWAIAIVSFVGFITRIFFAKTLIEKAEKNGDILPYLKKK